MFICRSPPALLPLLWSLGHVSLPVTPTALPVPLRRPTQPLLPSRSLLEHVGVDGTENAPLHLLKRSLCARAHSEGEVGTLPPPLALPSRLCLQYPLTVVMGGRDRYKICRSARSLGAPPQARMQIFKICTGQDDRIHTSQCTVNYMRPVCHLMHRIFGSRPGGRRRGRKEKGKERGKGRRCGLWCRSRGRKGRPRMGEGKGGRGPCPIEPPESARKTRQPRFPSSWGAWWSE